MQRIDNFGFASMFCGARSVLCVSPEHPDGDSIASICALKLFLERGGTTPYQVTLWCPDKIHRTPVMDHIPGNRQVKNTLPRRRFDTVIVCDYGSLDRARLPEDVLYEAARVFGVDHHPPSKKDLTRDDFYALIDEKAASATQVLFRFFKSIPGAPITPDIAKCLLVGLATDTGFFIHDRIPKEALEDAEELENKYGASLLELRRLMIPRHTRATIHAWKLALNTLELTDNFAAIAVNQKNIVTHALEYRDIASLSGALFERTPTLDVVLVLTEEKDGKWRGMLRSPSGKIALNKIAERFGGGGHKHAAAFISAQGPNEIIRTVKKIIRK